MIKKQDVRQLLVRTEKARQRIMQPYLSQLGLAFGQGHARILNTLLDRDHISQRQLADLCHVDATTMSRSLDKLEESGYLTRERDPGCRRSFLICLTPDGAQTARMVRLGFDFIDARIWNGFDEEEMELFLKGLSRVCENLEACREIHIDSAQTDPQT
ncbi:MAG: MarR family transcriptional regulator [Clostridiales bacterium]|nr:MarR family transcriptional regulator [Clostridiales bacterium]